jgi:hypothetical protein
MAAAGYTQTDKRAGHVHECWEFHDGARVITILDKTMPVQAGPCPYWHGEIPFQVYRPTNVLHEMVGIGEAEAIEDLQDEMNELRTQRRDNAQLVVQRPFAYFDGLRDRATSRSARASGSRSTAIRARSSSRSRCRISRRRAIRRRRPAGRHRARDRASTTR